MYKKFLKKIGIAKIIPIISNDEQKIINQKIKKIEIYLHKFLPLYHICGEYLVKALINVRLNILYSVLSAFQF